MSEADLRELRVCASPELRIGRVYRPVYSGLVHTGITAILDPFPRGSDLMDLAARFGGPFLWRLLPRIGPVRSGIKFSPAGRSSMGRHAG